MTISKEYNRIIPRMIFRLLTTVLILSSFIGNALAITPLEHESLLQNPDKMIRKSTPEDEEDPYLLLTGEADKAIADKDYPTAILRLREAIAMRPDNPSNALLLSNLGIMYSYLDQDSLALDAYDKVLSLAPSMVTVRKNRALLMLKMGRDREAWADFDEVIKRDSLSATARYYHGMISLYAGDLKVANTDFQILKDIDPEGYNTQVAMSSFFSLTGQDREAIPYYKKLIELDKAVEFYSALAGCYLAIGELSDASAIIAEGMKECGEDPELYYYRAWLRRETYLHDEAKADAKRAIELGADPRRVHQLFTK